MADFRETQKFLIPIFLSIYNTLRIPVMSLKIDRSKFISVEEKSKEIGLVPFVGIPHFSDNSG